MEQSIQRGLRQSGKRFCDTCDGKEKNRKNPVEAS